MSTPLKFRSKRSFGLSGVLDEGCQIFYHALFHARQIGRITDLLAARFHQTGVDEGRFRALLTVGLFHRLSNAMKEGGEPAMLEVGIDARFVGVGLSFDAIQPIDEALIERVKTARPSNDAEWVLTQWNSLADHLVIRFQPHSKRFEMIALVDLKARTQVEDRWGDLSQRIQFIPLDLHLDAEVKAGNYLELGDLEYAKLLQDEVAMLGKNVTSGEYMQTVAGQASSRESILSVTGPAADVGMDRSTFEIKGDAEQTSQEPPIEVATTLKRAPRPKSRWKRVTSFVRRMLGGADDPASDPANDFVPEDQDVQNSGPTVVARVRPVKRAAKPKVATIVPQSSEEPVANAPDEDGGDTDPNAALAEGIREELEASLEISEIGELDASMDRLELQASKFKEEIKSGRAKEILDGMMGELTVQKAKLREASRQMQLAMSKKELTLKSERITMQETLRKNEMTIRQKEAALANAKEQLANVSAHLDRARAASSSTLNEAQWKKKFDQALEEAERVRTENESLKKKLDAARVTQTVGRDKSTAQIELGTLKEKYSRMVRQVEDLKRQNSAMMEKVQADRTASPKSDAQRVKLEQAVRLANERKVEADQLRERVTKMEQEELRLKRKVQELRNQVAQAQQQAAKKQAS